MTRRSQARVASDHAWRVYTQWCAAVEIPCVPVTDASLDAFFRWLDVVNSDLGCIFDATHFRFQLQEIATRHEAATGEALKETVNSIASSRFDDASALQLSAGAAAARYLTRRHIRTLLASTGQTHPATGGLRAVRDRAVVHLAYTAALTAREIGELLVDDVTAPVGGHIEMLVRAPHRRVVRLTPTARPAVCGPCAIHDVITSAMAWDQHPRTQPLQARTQHTCGDPLPPAASTGYLVRAVSTAGHLSDGTHPLLPPRIGTIIRKTADSSGLPIRVRDRVVPALLRQSRYAQLAIDVAPDHEVLALFGHVSALTEVRRLSVALFPWINVLLDGHEMRVAPDPAPGFSDAGAGL